MIVTNARALLLGILIVSGPAWADSFEIQPSLRAAQKSHWHGNEFSLHYQSHDEETISYGAYFSNTTWKIDRTKRGQTKEFGPEIRFNHNLDPFLVYAGLQYALLSEGSYSYTRDIGAKVRGPRLGFGVLYPLESIGLILNFGVSKGWERLYSYADQHTSADFSSHSFFIGFSI